MSKLTEFLEKEVKKNKENNEEKKPENRKPETIAGCLEEYPKDADKCTWSTHVGKFVHPSVENVAARVSHNASLRDGAVYTANTVCDLDIAVSARYMATAKLLALKLEDGGSVFEHFRDDSEQIRQEFSALGVDYEKARAEALEIKEGGTPTDTDDHLRQVFFPLDDGGYHLLSVLPSSSLMMALKTRMDALEKKAINANKKKSASYGQKYQRVLDTVCIRFGGSQPQNISYLNNQNSGKAYMFLSVPHKIENRDITRPRKDFFKDTLVYGQFRNLFQDLHDCYECERNNMETRQNARTAEEHIIDKVLTYADYLRALPEGWTDGKNVALSKAQKLWLDEKYAEQSAEDKDWRREIADSMTRWMLYSYEKIMKDKAFELGATEYSFLRKEILQAL